MRARERDIRAYACMDVCMRVYMGIRVYRERASAHRVCDCAR